ncbi:hypothetical protein Fmac_010078 [Flemingia macrophylla]|uniref:Cytochrome P450 n=1 Tax=Flemingia macrophylla TaxID=520843 RepID=A0ABD1N3C9_9FABA
MVMEEPRNENHNNFPVYFITSVLFFLLVLFKLVKGSDSSKNLPPGPRALPLIGNIHHLLGSPPHESLKKLADKYGPLMHLKLGEVSTIIITSPEMAQQIMKTHDLNFSDRPNLLSTRIVSYNGTDIAFSQLGDSWRQLRKLCTAELFTPKSVQSFRSIREDEVSVLLEKVGASEGSIFNLSQSIYHLTYGIAARAAFGKKSRHQEAFLAKIDEQLQLLGGFSVADLYPSSRVLRMMAKLGKLETLHRDIDRMLQDIIDEHKNRKSSIEGEAVEDLVDVLLKFQSQKGSDCTLTDENIKAVVQDIFVGGGETSSSVVEWAMSELIRNPRVMEEAQVEVRRVFDSKGYVDETELHQLIYLKSIIKETMRLHPPLPLLIPRASREMCQINGYEIPSKTRVIINVWAIGRDPKYWLEAESFKPERFLNNSIDFKGTNFEFIPFGAGRRICPGIPFAIPNIELPFAQLLYNFDWKLPKNIMNNEELDMTGSHGITLRRQNDLCLIPITRKP